MPSSWNALDKESLLDQTLAGLQNLLLGPSLLFLIKCNSSKNNPPLPCPLPRAPCLCSGSSSSALSQVRCEHPACLQREPW